MSVSFAEMLKLARSGKRSFEDESTSSTAALPSQDEDSKINQIPKKPKINIKAAPNPTLAPPKRGRPKAPPKVQEFVRPADNKLLETFKEAFNEEQRDIFYKIIGAKEQLLMYLAGKAGTGKSFIVRALHAYGRCIVVAPTAAAASVTGGRTIHSFFCINPETSEFKVNAAKFNDINTLIIDEISMVNIELLLTINRACCVVKNSQRLFGGMNVILCGDFFQLAPVGSERKELLFQQKIFKNFSLYTLHRNMRQTDLEFIENLNHIRTGTNLELAVEYFNQFYDPKIMKTPIEKRQEMTIVTPLKRTVDEINKETLQWFFKTKPKGEGALFSREDSTIDYKLLPRDVITIKHSDLESIVPSKLIVFPGIRLMVTKNINEFVHNGLMVTVDKFVIKSPKDYQIFTHYMYKGQKRLYEFNRMTFYSNKPMKVLGLPLTYSYAVTVNKCQGLTLPNAILDLKNSFMPGMIYVALSRVTSSNHMKLTTPLTIADIKVDDRVIRFGKCCEAGKHYSNLVEENLYESDSEIIFNSDSDDEVIVSKKDEIDTKDQKEIAELLSCDLFDSDDN